MIGHFSLILSLFVACETEPDSTEVDQALEQFEPKGPTFEDRINSVKRRIGSGLEKEAIAEIDTILKKHSDNESYWRLLYYAVWASHSAEAIRSELTGSEMILTNTEHYQNLLLELASTHGEWNTVAQLAQSQSDLNAKVGWTALAIINGAGYDTFIGELPEENPTLGRRSTEPEPLPEVSPEVAFYRLLVLEEFPEGHQEHYQTISASLVGPEIQLSKAAQALKNEDTSTALNLYTSLSEGSDLILVQKALFAMGDLSEGKSKFDIAKTSFELAKDEGNPIHGFMSFQNMVEAAIILGDVSSVENYLATSFDEKEYLFKDVESSWIHYAVAHGALKIGDLDMGLKFATKIRSSKGEASFQYRGAILESVFALESGQGTLIQELATESSNELQATEVEEEASAAPEDTEPQENTEGEGQQPAADAVETPSELDETADATAAVSFNELNQLVLSAYRGESQSLSKTFLDEVPSELKLPLILALSRRGLENGPALLSEHKKTGSKLSQITVAMTLVELSMLQNDNANSLALIQSQLDAHSAHFPNIVYELNTRQYLLGSEFVAQQSNKELRNIWSALSGHSAASACLSKSCIPLKALTEIESEGAEGVVKSTQSIWESLPLHRQGILSTGTVMDGSFGIDFSSRIGKLVGATDDIKVGLAATYQELERRREAFRTDSAYGLNPLINLPDEDSMLLMDATYTARIKMYGYYAGGEFPSADLDALVEVEESFFEGDKLNNFKPVGRLDIFGLRDRLERISLLSYSVVGDDVIGVVVSPDNAVVKNLGALNDIQILYQKHYESHLQSLEKESFEHNYGHKLRQMLYDPFESALKGYGRYIVIGPEFMYRTSFMSFPEQQDGLLFLARNRYITFLPSLYEVNKSASEFGSFESDIVSFAKHLDVNESEVALDPMLSRSGLPPQVEVAKVHFRPDSRKFYIDEEATHEAYLDSSMSTRFLFITGIDRTKDGGWALDDKSLTLSEIQSQSMVLQSVFISYDPDLSVQIRRARAYMNAGARAVVISSWEIPQARMRDFLDGVFEALTRDDPLNAALKRGREVILKQRIRENNNQSDIEPNPSIWGSFLVFGQP